MFRYLLLIGIWPTMAFANICQVENSLYKVWLEQSNWSEAMITPSPENPGIKYKVYESSQGVLKTGSLSVSQNSAKGILEYSFAIPQQEEKFLKKCRDDSLKVPFVDEDIPSPQLYGRFKIHFPFFPGIKISDWEKLLDYSKVEAKVILKENSIVEKNSYFIGLDKVKTLINQSMNQQIKEQLLNGYSEDFNIPLDGLAELACDLLKGRATIALYHIGEREMDKVVITTKMTFSELKESYDKIKDFIQKLRRQEEKEFLAGYTWGEERDGQSKVASYDADVYIDLIEMSENKEIEDLDLTCVLEKSAKYSRKDKFQNVFNIHTQSLEQIGGQ